MLEAAVKAAGGMRVLAVTVLTSLDDADLAAIGAQGPVGELVKRRAELAIAAGCARRRRLAARGRRGPRDRAERAS